MEITEKMRLAFYEATEITSVGSVRNLDAGLRAALSAAPVAVKVKPLEWKSNTRGGEYAEADIGIFAAISGYPIHHGWHACFRGSYIDGGRIHTRIEDAKAIAQADYERRVLSTLSPAPVSEPEPVALSGEFPERIWAGDFDENGFGHCVAGMQGGLYEEYVRADMVDAAPVGAELQPQCCMCGKKGLSTVEGDGGTECELSDGRWTCSQECWERAVDPQPVAWAEVYGGKIVSVSIYRNDHHQTPLFTAPPSTERMREALEKISSPTQTTDLLWWQIEARAALADQKGGV